MRRHDPTAHAEILALRAGGAALGNYRLAGCVLAVTLEPCAMCAAALVHARLAGVVYGAADDLAGAVISRAEYLDAPFCNHRVLPRTANRGRGESIRTRPSRGVNRTRAEDKKAGNRRFRSAAGGVFS